MLDNKIKEENKHTHLLYEVLVRLPKKLVLDSEETIVVMVKNISQAEITNLRITSDKLFVTKIIEEKETSKAIEEVQSFTLESFNSKPRSLRAKHVLLISAKFKVTELEPLNLALLVEYEVLNSLTNKTDSIILKIQDFK